MKSKRSGILIGTAGVYFVSSRLAAKGFHAAFNGQPSLESNIKLTLKIHVGPVNNRTIGDLDTFITGVCDGLMAAYPGSKLDPIWDDPKLEHIHPSKMIAIVDDSQVVSIQAEKIIGDPDQQWYEMTLEGE